MTPLIVLGLLGQLPITPPLTAEPLRFAAPPSVPIAIVGKPALTWDGTSWGVAWRDRRRSGPLVGVSHVWVTSWNGGPFVDAPQGLPIAGSGTPLALSDDLQLVSTATFSLMAFPQRSLDGGLQITAVSTTLGPEVSNPWLPPFDLSQGRPVTTGSLTMTSNDAQALVAWYGGQDINLVTFPGRQSGIINAGPNVSSLSVGVADGGFLVAWLDGSSIVKANLLESTTLAVLSMNAPAVANARAVRVVSTPRVRMVTTVAVGGQWASHTFMGSSWMPTTAWPNASAIAQPFVTATNVALVGLYRPNLTTSSFALTSALLQPDSFSTTGLTGPVTAMPAALTQDGTRAMALVLDRSQLFGQQYTVSTGLGLPTATASALTPLLNAPLSQDAPSAVWVREESAFLLAWDEEQSDGGSAVMTGWVDPTGVTRGPPTRLLGALPLDGGVRPALLRRRSGSGYAVHVREPSSTLRAVYALSIDGGSVSLGAQLTMPRLLQRAVLGDSIAVAWGVAGPTMFFIGNDVAAVPLTLSGPQPRCAAQFDGGLWFATQQNALTIAIVDDDAATPNPRTVRLDAGSTFGAVCSLGSNDGTGLSMAWRSDGRLVYASAPRSNLSGLTVTENTITEVQDPLLVETSDGVVMAWAASGQRGVEARLNPHDANGLFSLGGVDVNNVAVASSPQGLAAVVWDSFVPDGGFRQVMVRLLGTFDGGTGVTVDAGAPDAGAPDAGARDAGTLDGGAPDGGTPDGGPFDAGAPTLDGGLAPDGGALVFTPSSCGCQGTPGAFSILLVPGLLRRRARRSSR